MARLSTEKPIKSTMPSASTEEIAARLEALRQRGPQAMPAYLEHRIQQRLSEATFSLPDAGRTALMRRLIVLLVALTVLWTLYLSYMQRAQGDTNAVSATRSAAKNTPSIAAVRNGALCK